MSSKSDKSDKPILEHPQPKPSNGTPPSIMQLPPGSVASGPSSSNLKQSPSVSFSNNEQEKLRRFTISAQPSSANLNNQEFRKNSLQVHGSTNTIPTTHGLSRLSSGINTGTSSSSVQVNPQVVQGQTNSQNSSRNNSVIGGDFFSFLTKSNHPIPNSINVNQLPGSNHSSRVTTPTMDQGYVFRYRDSKISPSPPPENAPMNISSGLSSPSNPINVSRKGSLMKKSNKTIVESPVGPPVPFQQYLSKEDDNKIHILIGCTGSVATIKVPLIIDKLFQIYGANKVSIQLIATKSAGHFLKGLKINNNVKIWRDEDEWANFSEKIDYFHNVSQPTSATSSSGSAKPKKNPFDKLILHNELRKWADIMLIAPLSANTLAKIANGISDNLLTSTVRSWNYTVPQTAPTAIGSAPPPIVKKPILVAPAMNTFMYTHPLTAKQLNLLASTEYGFGMEILKPVEKVLICGDIGMGGMREWNDIVDILRRRVAAIKNLEGPIDEDAEGEDDDEDDEDDDDEDDDDEDDDDEDEDEDEEDEDEDENDEDENEVQNVKGKVKGKGNDEMIFDIKA
ncbi:coenzyme A biosynthesis protein 3 [[Candida] jaroonii]|uniref:Coenzyme A biosynthesis protein 3 n=1 Tax=[Candida] jaroonii TaxID=467808 RepID=A0ACA9Y4C0_9ASCO|nr:coenzyme A biosynthesis protein 3 [[Candida] jaroonii]